MKGLINTLLFGLMIAQMSFATGINVYGLTTQSFQNLSGIIPCYLNGGEIGLQKLNKSLRGVTTHKQLTKKDRAIFRALSKSYICRYRAKSLGIDELPAIVFDQHFVVYGITNLNIARQYYANYLAQHSLKLGSSRS